MYLLFGSFIRRRLDPFVSALGGGISKICNWLHPNTHKRKKRVSRAEQRARAKAMVRKFVRRALVLALVIRCRRRSGNKPKALVSILSEPLRWKWKERNAVGLESVISRLKPTTLDSFCARNNDFLRLPRLMGTLCNYDHHFLDTLHPNAQLPMPK